MIKINLVPQEILDKEIQKQRLVQVGIAAGFLFLIFAGVSFKHYYRGVTLAKTLAEQEAKFDKLAKIVAQVEALEQQAKAVRGRLDVMKELNRSRPLYPRFMGDLLSTFPKGVYLKSLTTTTAGMKIVVSMGAESVSSQDVSDWYRTLEVSEKFHGPKMGALSLTPEGIVNFSMAVDYEDKTDAEKGKS